MCTNQASLLELIQLLKYVQTCGYDEKYYYLKNSSCYCFVTPKSKKPYKSLNYRAFHNIICTRSGNRTRTAVRPQDFKSCVSTYSTIPASLRRMPELLLNNKALLVRALRAKDEIRTRDPDLGKVVLYQLSYFRLLINISEDLLSPCFVCAKVKQISIFAKSTIKKYENLFLRAVPALIFRVLI